MKDIVKKILYYSGFYKSIWLLNLVRHPRLIIIMLHDLIEDNSEADAWSNFDKPGRSQFEVLIRFLNERYRILSVEDAMEEISGEGRIAEPTVALTFDDGCRSVYDIAFPELKKHNTPATVFLPTDWINGKMTPWWILLAGILNRMDDKKETKGEIENIVGRELNFDSTAYIKNSSMKFQLQAALENLLRNRSETEINGLMEKLETIAGSAKASGRFPGGRPLSWENIREMSDHRIRFGAHTRSHLNLSLSDPEKAIEEIRSSKDEIEKRISQKVTGFAYPYGFYSNPKISLEDTLSRLGFDYALTTDYGFNDISTNRFYLRRTTVPLTASTAILDRHFTLDFHR